MNGMEALLVHELLCVQKSTTEEVHSKVLLPSKSAVYFRFLMGCGVHSTLPSYDELRRSSLFGNAIVSLLFWTHNSS